MMNFVHYSYIPTAQEPRLPKTHTYIDRYNPHGAKSAMSFCMPGRGYNVGTVKRNSFINGDLFVEVSEYCGTNYELLIDILIWLFWVLSNTIKR